MNKIDVFFGIIFKRVWLELSDVGCFLECILEGIFFYLMSSGTLLTRDAPPIEPTARAGINAISLSTRLERAASRTLQLSSLMLMLVLVLVLVLDAHAVLVMLMMLLRCCCCCSCCCAAARTEKCDATLTPPLTMTCAAARLAPLPPPRVARVRS